MFKRLPSTSPAPDRAFLRKLHNSGRNAFSAKLSLSRRALLLPCVGLLVSASLLACGSDEPQPQTVSDQPLATQMVTEATKSNGNTPSTDTGGQNNGDNPNPAVTTESDGQNPPEMPTATTPPPEMPTATTPPPATATPTPVPTDTPVPMPTPDPRVVMMELLTKTRAGVGTPLEYRYIYSHNHKIIAPLLAEKTYEQFQAYREEDGSWLNDGQWHGRLYNGLHDNQMTFERINEESPDLHAKIAVTFEHELRTGEDVTYTVTANAVFEMTPAEDSRYERDLLGVATHFPTFSHFTNEPVMERQ